MAVEILIVEPNASTLDELADALLSEVAQGYVPLSATNKAEAVEQLADYPKIQLVILTTRSSKEPGPEIYEALRKQGYPDQFWSNPNSEISLLGRAERWNSLLSTHLKKNCWTMCRVRWLTTY